MPSENPAVTIPRVFVSYSWSSSTHQAWVLALAEKLRGDGVDVILDKWDLSHGQDAYAFMERMVTDPTVTKVLMISDRAYVEKANDRRGGVGSEALIISPQLYRAGATNQTRFAAACVELDSTDQPCVPVFFQGRIHFDFTRRDNFDAEYESVLRWAFDRPRHVRPPLGQMPASLEGPSTDSTPGTRLSSASPGAIERAEAFRLGRLAEISVGKTPVTLAAGAVAILHLVPLPSLQNSEAVDIVAMISNGTHMPVPMAGSGGTVSVNLLGVCNTLGESGYGQLFRGGAYEGTLVLSEHDGTPYVASTAFANMVVGAVRRGLALQAHYGFAFPTAAMLSFCNAAEADMRLPTEFGAGYYQSQRLGEAVVAIPFVILSGSDVDVPAVLRPLLNATWNAFGQAGCNMYNGHGTWIGVA